MDEQLENPRLRALLLGTRNQLDWLWRLADQQGTIQSSRVEGVLKLIGAIDYALGIEPYTLDLDPVTDGGDLRTAPPQARDEDQRSSPVQQANEPVSNGYGAQDSVARIPGMSHPLDIHGESYD
jgi:hypothetical protein